MSVRNELLRLGLRLFKRSGSHPDIDKIRRGTEWFLHITPNPPRGTETIRVMAGRVPSLQVTTPQSRHDCHVLHLHGGGYTHGSPALYRDFTWRIANAAAARVLCIDYRLAPEHPFPAAVEDAVAAYRWLLATGADPARTAILGDSAGGGLTFGTLLRLRDDGDPLPGAAVALSPWTDLALTGNTMRTNAKADPMLNVAQAHAFANFYLGGADPRNPYASPIFGDPHGLPPSLIQVGSDEVLRDDAERMARNLRAAGCVAELEVWPRMPHVWQLYARILPEGRRAIDRIGLFLQRYLAGTA